MKPELKSSSTNIIIIIIIIIIIDRWSESFYKKDRKKKTFQVHKTYTKKHLKTTQKQRGPPTTTPLSLTQSLYKIYKGKRIRDHI